ncbi:MAG TPA: hypothetical protein VI702_00100, partial [Nitrospiria bacterium]
AGESTLVFAPYSIFVDMLNNQLYTGNSDGTIVVFNRASTADGNLTPARMIMDYTNMISSAVDLYMDPIRNRLYVADDINMAVYIFDNADSISVDFSDPENPLDTPANSIIYTGTLDQAIRPAGLALDGARDILYVSDFDYNRVLVYDGASAINGLNSDPFQDPIFLQYRTISDPSLNAPLKLFLDDMNDRLYAAGNADIKVFDNASSSTVVMSRTISLYDPVNFTTLPPMGVFVDTGKNILYASTFDYNFYPVVYVFEHADTVQNTVIDFIDVYPTPDRIIELPADTWPTDIFVDVTPIAFPSTPALDGRATAAGGAPSTPPDVGDLTATAGVRGFYSFDIQRIPSNAKITSAALNLFQRQIFGDPYATLGHIIVDHLDYGPALDGSVYNMAALTENIGTLSTDPAVEYKKLGVTGSVQNDHVSSRTRSQYRLRFSDQETDGDAVSDVARFTDAENIVVPRNPPQLMITVAP